MMALPFLFNKVKIRRFFYAETICRLARKIILSLDEKAVTGGFFSHFEP